MDHDAEVLLALMNEDNSLIFLLFLDWLALEVEPPAGLGLVNDAGACGC